jgi:predicted nucleic acid-binding protein
MVIDASAIAALVFSEPEAYTVRSKLSGRTLNAPVLVDFELANIRLMKLRRDPLNAAFYRAGFESFLCMPIERRSVDMSLLLELAERHGLTSYDASYLALAKMLGEPLFTLDRRLAMAAASTGH